MNNHKSTLNKNFRLFTDSPRVQNKYRWKYYKFSRAIKITSEHCDLFYMAIEVVFASHIDFGNLRQVITDFFGQQKWHIKTTSQVWGCVNQKVPVEVKSQAGTKKNSPSQPSKSYLNYHRMRLSHHLPVKPLARFTL